MISSPRNENRNIAILVYEGVRVFELGVAFEAFSTSKPESLEDWYDVRAVSADGTHVNTDSGFQIVCEDDLSDLNFANTIIVPGWRNIDQVPPDNILDALRVASARGCRIVSFCSGAFVLGHAGLLDGKCATTHWRWSTSFRAQFPNVDLRAESLFNQSGNIFTSGGSAAALDLCLALIEQDCGLDTSMEVSRRIIMPLRREGNQAQFFGSAKTDGLDERFGTIEKYVCENLDAQMTVAKLAKLAKMSERTFSRKFTDVYKASPAKWLRHQRMLAARSMLRSADTPIAEIAVDVGFHDLPTFVLAFKREFQMTPSSYRKSLNRQ